MVSAGRVARELTPTILAKAQDGDDAGALAHGQLEEAAALLAHQLHPAGLRLEAFPGAADYDGDRPAAAAAATAGLGRQAAAKQGGGPGGGPPQTEGGPGRRHALAAQDGLARALRHAGEAEGQQVLAVEGDFEVVVDGQQRVADSGEQLLEAGGLGHEVAEGAVRDDAVWVVGEDVVAGRVQRRGAMQAHGEVVGVQPPHGQPAQELGAPVGRRAVHVLRVDEEDVDQVGQQQRPAQRDGQHEPEQAEAQRHG